MNRAKIYHVNPVCNKWEEENLKRNMERAIRSAKPAVATYASGQKSGASRGGMSRPGSRQAPGQLTPPMPPPLEAARPPLSTDCAAVQENVAPQLEVPAGIDVHVLDALIERRLKEVLGEPLIQRIQQQLLDQKLQAVGATHTVLQCQQLTESKTKQQPDATVARKIHAAANGKRRKNTSKPSSDAAAAAKPPRARPQWDENWAVPGPAQPLCAGAFPLPPASRTARSPSPSHHPASQPPNASPYKAAPASSTRGGPANGRQSQQQQSGRNDGAVRVQLLPSSSMLTASARTTGMDDTRSGTPASPAQCARYSGNAPDAAAGLTASHAATIAALNFNTAALEATLQPHSQSAGESSNHGSSQGSHNFTSTQHTRGGEDLGLMSLSRLSSAHRQNQVVSSAASSLHTMLPRRFSAGPSHNASPATPSKPLPAMCASGQQRTAGCPNAADNAAAGAQCTAQRQDAQRSSDVYSDDFEVVGDNELSEDEHQDDPVIAEAGACGECDDGAEHVRTDPNLRRQTVHELQKSVAHLTQLVQTKIHAVLWASIANGQDVESAAEMEDMMGTLGLLGEDAEFGMSSDLLAGSQLLTSAELQYLGQLGGGHSLVEQESDVGDLPAWARAQEMEAGIPTGTGHGWDNCMEHEDRTSSPTAAQPALRSEQQEATWTLQTGNGSRTQAALARLKQLQEQKHLPAAIGHEHHEQAVAAEIGAQGSSQVEDDHVLLGTVAASDIHTNTAAHLATATEQAGQDQHAAAMPGQVSAPVDALASVLRPTGGPPVDDGGLAGQVVALWDSLRQLHHLMSGPRGAELSRPGTAQQVPRPGTGLIAVCRRVTSPASCLPNASTTSQQHSPLQLASARPGTGQLESVLVTVPEHSSCSPSSSCQVLCVEHATPDAASPDKYHAGHDSTWSDAAAWSDAEPEPLQPACKLDGDHLGSSSTQNGFDGQDAEAAAIGDGCDHWDGQTLPSIQQLQGSPYEVGIPDSSEHVWMAGLMHTLSRSLGGEELLQEMMLMADGFRKL